MSALQGAYTFPGIRHPKATLRDVALAAGVSLATASRALSRPKLVSEQVREAIAAASARLGYIPNHVARALTLDRSQAIGLIVPNLAQPIFADLVDGVQRSVEAAGFGLLINACQRDATREHRQVRTLLERGVDAVVLGNPEHLDATFEMLERAGVPYVCAACSSTASYRPAVTYETAALMQLTVDLVVRQGHRHIAVLSGEGADTPVIADRIAGSLARLAWHGLPPPPEWVVISSHAAEAARGAAATLLDHEPRPTAVVCTGDMHAMAVLAEAQRRGIAVPRQLSVTGCNDSVVARYAGPGLTGIHVPYAEIGARAAQQALALLAGETIPARVLLPPRLMERGTVAPPP